MRGFSTIEIIIATAVMVSAIGSVALLSFGNQSLLAQSRAQEGAVQKARMLLENEAELAAQDFRLVSDDATSTSGIYRSSLSISDVASDPYTTKRATAIVSWSDVTHTIRQTSLTELLTDFSDPSTLDTCDPELIGDWETPSIKTYALAPGDLLPANAPAGHSFSSTNPIATLDAYHGRLYVGVSKKSAAANDSLFVFDISDPSQKPTYLGSTDTNASATGGPTFVLVAGTSAYVANSRVSNFKTCKPSSNCSQLQIFSIATPGTILAPDNFLVPTSSAPFVMGTTTDQALGNTLFYKDGYIYLGLSKTATGPEFNIIDVHDPNNPAWVGGYQVGATINQIYVRNGYAYLADDDKSREFIVLNVDNPSNPYVVASFDPKGTLGYEVGESEYLRGNTLFAGMSAASGSPEIYALDATSPTSLPLAGSHIVGSTVLGLFARDSTLFLLASTIGQFQMLDDSNPALIGTSTTLSLPGTGAALDCEGNYFFVASNSGSQGFISIIGPAL